MAAVQDFPTALSSDLSIQSDTPAAPRKKYHPEWNIIQAYYASPFPSLEITLCEALEEYNRNRRKRHALEGESRPHGAFSNTTIEKISAWFSVSDHYLNRLYEDTQTPTEFKNQLGLFIRQRMIPWMYFAHFPKRILEKKEGFIGDHYTIEMMYMGSVNAIDRIHPLGRVIDHLFLSLPSCHAVRERRQVLSNFLINEIHAKHDSHQPLKITSVGCGKAREIEDVFRTISPDKISVTLLDVDIRALSGARDAINRIPGAMHRVKVKEFNAKRMQLTKELQEPQDVIYSAGLLDYFDDTDFIDFFCMAYDALAEQGKLIIGNYSLRNPTKGTMRYLLDWDLYFRSEAHMLSLVKSTGKPYHSASFFYDTTHRIQPFLMVQK